MLRFVVVVMFKSQLRLLVNNWLWDKLIIGIRLLNTLVILKSYVMQLEEGMQ